MAKRKKIPLTVQLAACMAELQSLRGDAIPYDHLKRMTAEQYLSLYEVDHASLHCWTQNDHFANLTLMLRPAHKIKTRRDRKIIAKVNKAVKKRAALVSVDVTGDRDDGANAPPKRQWPSRKMQSRPWPKKLSGKTIRRGT